jgi:hypothetical protein
LTTASTVFEAVRTAVSFFLDPFWKGPKPVPETIFTVTLVGDSRKWRVVGRAASKSESAYRQQTEEAVES